MDRVLERRVRSRRVGASVADPAQFLRRKTHCLESSDPHPPGRRYVRVARGGRRKVFVFGHAMKGAAEPAVQWRGGLAIQEMPVHAQLRDQARHDASHWFHL